MNARHPKSQEDWVALLGSGDDLLQAAMEAGFRADKPSLWSLLEVVHQTGVPPALMALERGVSVVAIDSADDDESYQRIRCADLMIAVAAALSMDGESRSFIKLHELQSLTQDQHSVHPRLTWEAIDESLMQSSIALWRKGNPNNPASEPGHLAQWAKVVAQHVHHGEAVHALARAGIDLADLGGWLGHLTRPEERVLPSDVTWFKNSKFSAEAPLPVFAANLGNFAVADAWLNTMPTSAAGPMAGFLIDQVTKIEDFRVMGSHAPPLPRAIDACLEAVLAAEANGDGSDSIYRPLVELVGTVSRLVETLDAETLQAVPTAQRAQMALLSHSIGLSRNFPNGRWSPGFVQAMLDLPCDELGALRDALGRETELFTCHLKLILMAAQAHCPPVIEVSRLDLLGDSGEAFGARSLSHVLAHAACIDRTGPFVAADFKETLATLARAGCNVAGPFADYHTSSATTLLHAIAAMPRHADRMAALVVGLDAGCDPEARNHRNRRASACVKDLSQRAQWVGIEKSHLARRSALAALAELDLAGPPPHSPVRSPCP